MKKIKKNDQNFALPAIIALVSMISILVGIRLGESLRADGLITAVSDRPSLAISEALDYIEEKYYGTPDYITLTDEVIGEMAGQLDPYSHYFKPEMDQRFDHFIAGTYEGLGFEFFYYRDSTYITKVLAESPAQQAGLKRGDVLFSVDSISLLDHQITSDSIRKLFMRPIGSPVQVVWFNPLSRDLRSGELVISNVQSPLVSAYLMDDSTTLYLEVKRFSKGTFSAFMDAIDHYDLLGVKINALIIDVRSNPGGILSETIKILNQLIVEKEAVLASTRNKEGRLRKFTSNGRSFLSLDNLAVIINENSASASEILAGALQDHDLAVVVGRPSYGKGLIQQKYPLSNDGAINMTVGEYILPSGRGISRGTMSTYSQDTAYTTLRLKRPIKNGGGVLPDLMIDSLACPELSGPKIFYDMCRTVCDLDLGFSQFLSTPYNFSEVTAAIESLVLEYEVTGACETNLRKELSWKYWNLIHPHGGVAKREVLDAWIAEAYDAIVLGDPLEYLRPTLE